ncbi:hypothetical protein FH608_004920 [Nonomuraea phyllanthi]|uniref:Uncharacterized protein n=1 Tax=Nonomuraea phyllanthi TaxID=2219224 RepID=A0A5C4WZ71_9ACTN|nr:hypothetical protein [Nonomuraea phyllanthi]KAB8197859.1 hypothetical protein FH608_004920 [Nonomuraea phyllanthi]
MGLLRLAVLLWLTVCHLRNGRSSPEASSAGPEPAPKAVGRPRGLPVIMGMFGLAALLGVAAWKEYRLAAPEPLYTRFDGSIVVEVTLPKGARALDLLTLGVTATPCAELREQVARCGPDTYDIMMGALAGENAPRCFDYRLGLQGDARMSEMELDEKPQPAPSKAISVITGKFCRERANPLLLRPVHIRGRALKPLVASRGYTTVLAAPAVIYADASQETSVSWDLGEIPLDSTVESSSRYGRTDDERRLAWRHPDVEPARPQPGAKLEWRPAVPESGGGYGPAPHARLVSLPEKQAAERALFWAGLLAGAAVSMLTWAGELLLENRRSRR